MSQLDGYEKKYVHAARDIVHTELDNILDNKSHGIGDTESWDEATDLSMYKFLSALGFGVIAKKYAALKGLEIK